MNNQKTNNLYRLIFFVLIILLYGCNVKSTTSYQGHLIFFYNNSKISETITSKKFLKIRKEIILILSKFGFVEDDEDMLKEDACFFYKSRHTVGRFSDLKGSDAAVSFAMSNFSYSAFDIIMKDRTNNYETEFFKSLKEQLIITLKKEFGFSDIYFKETGEFILNN